MQAGAVRLAGSSRRRKRRKKRKDRKQKTKKQECKSVKVMAVGMTQTL
jgi:hypothetical protein